MTVTIWHNPRCSKSRRTLKILNEKGIEPEIIDYQQTRPDKAEIRRILGLLQMTADQLIRKGEKIFKELELSGASEDLLISAMATNPILIERPIVEANGKAALGRPPESVLKIL